MYSARILVNKQAKPHNNRSTIYLALNTFAPSENPSSSSPSDFSDNGAFNSIGESVLSPKFQPFKPNYTSQRYRPYHYEYKPSHESTRPPVHMQIMMKSQTEIKFNNSSYQPYNPVTTKMEHPLYRYQPTYLPTPVVSFLPTTMNTPPKNSRESREKMERHVTPNHDLKQENSKKKYISEEKVHTKFSPKERYLPIHPDIITNIEGCIKGIKQSIRRSRVDTNMSSTIGIDLLDQVSTLLWNYKVMAYLEENLQSAKRVNALLHKSKK